MSRMVTVTPGFRFKPAYVAVCMVWGIRPFVPSHASVNVSRGGVFAVFGAAL